jgi:hypothetical protein
MVEAVTSSIVEATWRQLLLHLGWARHLLWAAATSACWRDAEKVQGVTASRVDWWEGVFDKWRSRAPHPSFFGCAMEEIFCRTADG